MKNRLLSVLAFFASIVSYAQYPVVTIQDIQFVQPAALGNCDDQTIYLGDTVIVRAKVVMDGDLAWPSGQDQNNPGNPNPTGHKNVWLQQGMGGAWSGLDVFQLSSISATEDIHNLLAGDSIEVVGVIGDYNGESQIVPLNGTSITLLGQGSTVVPTVVQIEDLNDENDINQLETGEQWEGVYAEFHNVTVVDVNNFSGDRYSFEVQDQFGNLLGVSDRFKVQKTPTEGGSFVPPNVGDQLDTLRGIVMHSKNGCPGNNGRGYELFPFDANDYVFGASAPSIFNIANSPSVPSSTDDVTVTAEITDNDGNVSSATIFYATGSSGGSFIPVSMTNTSGDIYTADIPAQADGTFVRWYITATDDSALVATLPNSDPSINAYAYRVRDNGLTIFDVNFTPFAGGNSPFDGQTVTVEGVVTASMLVNDTGDLGYVYIQQENQSNYAALWLEDVTAAGLSTLKRGELVEVEGVIGEERGMTVMETINSVNVIGTGTIQPTVLNPDDFTTADPNHEQYEGMLVRFENPAAGSNIYVVEENADESTGNQYNEYRVGTDEFALNGSRVIAGRDDASANSSLFVSYVNDSALTTVDGTMQVLPYVIKQGHYMASMQGIFYYSFGAMKLLPRNNHDIEGYGGGVVYAMGSLVQDSLCVGDTLRFVNMSSVIADDISWDFGDGSGTSNEMNPGYVYSAAGTYNASLVATNTVDNETATSNMIEVNVINDSAICMLSIEERINARIAMVYPNPTNDVITVATNLSNGTPYDINIVDLQGRTVIHVDANKAVERVDLTPLSTGTYYMHLTTSAGKPLGSTQIIKQ